MPLYLCTAAPDTISQAAAARLADEITRIHCEVTDAPPTFVHAFFVENPALATEGARLSLTGTIRAGRSDDQRMRIASAVRDAIGRHTTLTDAEVAVTIAETPASWVMEGGDIMPEPGEEEAWLAAHGRSWG